MSIILITILHKHNFIIAMLQNNLHVFTVFWLQQISFPSSSWKYY